MQRDARCRIRLAGVRLAAALAWLLFSQAGRSDEVAGKLVLTVGKSLSIDSPVAITKVATANDSLVETVAISAREVLINGKAPGETSLIVWRDNDTRLVYDLIVRASPLKVDVVREQISRTAPGAGIELAFENDTAFVRGTVKDLVTADRVMALAATLGKTVNLLQVEVPPAEPQILLRVRFANVDRSAGRDLGISLSSGAFNQSTALGTGPPVSTNGNQSVSLSQAINVFLFRRDLNLAAAIQALESKRLLEMLAEPNLLVTNGAPAHFMAGGEFPYPMVQPGAGANSVTIAFKEYGIRLSFQPQITPRGSIHLQVAPEVSALDYTNAVTVAGTTVPGTSTRRVETEVELDSGQSFVIAGLLDRQTRESLSKVPGISAVPVLGKLFQTKSTSRNHTELLVMITPEVVRPIPSGEDLPRLDFPSPFLPGMESIPPHSPAMPPAVLPAVPVEQLIEQKKKAAVASPAAYPIK